MKKFSAGTLSNCVTGVGAQGVSVIQGYGLVTDTNSWKFFTAPACTATAATSATLNAARGGSIAYVGSTYYDFFADTGNNQVRRWTNANNPITIVAGLNSPRAVAHIPAATTIYIAGRWFLRKGCQS